MTENVINEHPTPALPRLKELRHDKGLTMRQLAARAGLSHSAVEHIEGARVRRPNYLTRKALAEALGVSERELMGRAP